MVLGRVPNRFYTTSVSFIGKKVGTEMKVIFTPVPFPWVYTFVFLSSSVAYSTAKTPHPSMATAAANPAKQVTSWFFLSWTAMWRLSLKLKTVLFQVLPCKSNKDLWSFPWSWHYAGLDIVGPSGPEIAFVGPFDILRLVILGPNSNTLQSFGLFGCVIYLPLT